MDAESDKEILRRMKSKMNFLKMVKEKKKKKYHEHIIRGERYEDGGENRGKKSSWMSTKLVDQRHEKMAWMLHYRVLPISGVENRDRQMDRQPL